MPGDETPAAFGFRAQPFDVFEAEVSAQIGSTVRSSFKGRFLHEFANHKPSRDWLLKGVFLMRSLAFMVGESESGKSFLALDLGMSLARCAVDSTIPALWFGRKIKPCGVIYVAAEGQEDFLIRTPAWLMAKGLPNTYKMPFYLIPTAVDLRNPDAKGAEKLIEEINQAGKVMEAEFGCKAGVVVVDTYNRALGGGDDTKPSDVAAMTKSFAAIKEKCGITVIAIHHVAKNSKTTDPRGHGSIRNDNDVEVFVRRPAEGKPNSWTVARNKAGPTGDSFEFRLFQVVLGLDEDGDKITSCAVAPGAAGIPDERYEAADVADQLKDRQPRMTADGRVILADKLTLVMKALADIIDREGEFPPDDAMAPHGRKAVRMPEWTKEIIRTAASDDDKEDKRFVDLCRKRRDWAADRLARRGLIEIGGKWVWRTNRLVMSIDRPTGEKKADRDAVPPPALDDLADAPDF